MFRVCGGDPLSALNKTSPDVLDSPEADLSLNQMYSVL